MRISFILLLLVSTSIRAQAPLRVAVAANAQFVMEKLKASFETQTGQRVEVIVNSSGKLTTQIQQGAPYDVFLSADTTYPQTLYRAGLTTAAPVLYAYGSLVLWSGRDRPLSADLNGLLDPAVRHVAIANPKTAPYGAVALALLTSRRLLDKVRPKLVYAESIAQVNQYILSGAAEVGFTAKSVVLDPSLNGRGRWVDLPTAGPIAQGVVVLKRTSQPQAAGQFITFLRSPAARRILAQFGYRPPAP